MSIGSESDPAGLEDLSALTDGELDATATARACSAWRDDVAARSTWHAYQLIGDVLRSDDLASNPTRDAAFLAALRDRLAAEPVVLAPEAPAAPVMPVRPQVAANAGRLSRWSWMAPSAVAAGFVLVAGALFVTRSPLPGGAVMDASMASLGTAAPQGAVVPAMAASEIAEPQLAGINSRVVVRDPRIERYLAAHQQFAGTSALGVPSGFLRNAVAEVPTR